MIPAQRTLKVYSVFTKKSAQSNPQLAYFLYYLVLYPSPSKLSLLFSVSMKLTLNLEQYPTP